MKPSVHAWLVAEVAAGRFATLDAALSAAVSALRAADVLRDLAWTKPLIDESRAAVAAGQIVPLEAAFDHWDRTIADLKR